jgi:hypothetical protein
MMRNIERLPVQLRIKSPQKLVGYFIDQWNETFQRFGIEKRRDRLAVRFVYLTVD